MEIPEKVLKFKYHFLFALLFSLAAFAIVLLAPRLLTVLAYFWPLFVSTALFLAIVLVFAKTSPLPAADASHLKPVEELLDYVAGEPDIPFDAHNKSD
ncbi:hypothetical protein L6164_029504 [Bauhinia variegata]|uniref:Uncharacterized protein n=1 Tax=Bauhinia variegata TaxID=167791 RepID=A0ACB9LA01_BAUVA|nr:hypothetical protein L6164_029504 [Bauhinia variegata]